MNVDRETPLVSVVMPVRNSAAFVDRAVDSVVEQSYRYLELVIQDGGSTDGTLERLEARSTDDPRICVVSADDNGPADALNSGFKRAQGTLIGWLNADDTYADGAIARAVAALSADDRPLFCYGKGNFIDAEDAILGPYPTVAPPVTDKVMRSGSWICQPTVFWRRSLLTAVGPVDTSFQCAFDYELWLRVFGLASDRVAFVGEVQANSRLHADTITSSRRRDVAAEGMRAAALHLHQAGDHWMVTWLEEALARTDPAGANMIIAEGELLIEAIQDYVGQPSIERFREQLRAAAEQLS